MNNNKYKMVKLGEVVSYNPTFIIINEEEKYKLCRVQTACRGLLLRETKYGYEIKTKKQQICRSGQFIVAELDAKYGGYGIIPPELDGSIVSSHYFLFDINKNVLNEKFLKYLITTKWFGDQVIAQGSTNYSAVRPSQILEYVIPLPPLSEQENITNELDKVQKCIREILHLRKIQENEIKNLIHSIFTKIMSDSPKTEISEVLKSKSVGVYIESNKTYKQLTARWWNKGVTLRTEIEGNKIKSKQFIVEKGDFIISKIDARHAAYGIVPEALDGAVVTTDFPVFQISNINPEYFNFLIKTDYFLQECRNNSQGSTRRVRLNIERFLKIKIPIPEEKEQAKLFTILGLLNSFQAIENNTENELGTLLSTVINKAFRIP